jgi:predicted Zn-dependent protease
VQQNKVPAARKAFEDVLRLAPSSYDALVGLITVDLAQHNVNAARGRVAAWQQRTPDDPRLKILSARVALAAGNKAEAEQTLRALVSVDPSQLDAYDLLGRIAMANGQLDRALAEYQALASLQDAGRTLTLVARSRRRGDRDGARQQCERAARSACQGRREQSRGCAETDRLDDALKLATVAQNS